MHAASVCRRKKNVQRLWLHASKLIHETNSRMLERCVGKARKMNKIVGRPPMRLSSSLPSTQWAMVRAYRGHTWGDESCSLMSRASIRRPHCCPMIHNCRTSIATNALRPLSSAGAFINLLPSVSQKRTLARFAFSFRDSLLLRVCLMQDCNFESSFLAAA